MSDIPISQSQMKRFTLKDGTEFIRADIHAAELREAEEDAWEAGYDAARGLGGTRDDYFERKEGES